MEFTMKKILYASLIISGISVLLGMSYYISFKNALSRYNKEAVEQNTELLYELLQYSGENEQLLKQLLNQTPEAEAAASSEVLRTTASYFLETCYLQSQTEKKEELPLPGFMVGLTRKELTAYVEGYLESMPINEFLNGLISYEIVSFSPDKVVLRKIYDETKVENQFYLCRKGEFIVVYYSDLKTVYEYTEIRTDSLKEEIRQVVEQGFYVKDAQELYSILEGYTS